MALELNITLADSSLDNETDRADRVANISLKPVVPCLKSGESGALLDLSQDSACYPEEEEEEEERDINRNAIQPSLHNGSTPVKLTNCDTVESGDENHTRNVLGDSDASVTDSHTCMSSFDNNEDAVRTITTKDGQALLIQASALTPKSGSKMSRNTSLHGPRVTNIRIGTPLKRSSSMKRDNTQTSEVEYTISISSQSNVKVQMTTSPASHEVANVEYSSTNSQGENLLENNTEVTGKTSHHGREIKVGNQIVRLRAKKNHNRNSSATQSLMSPMEEMKRHSAEISQLRHSLEQRVMEQSPPSRRGYHQGSSPEIKRPTSALGYSRMYDSPDSERKTQLDNQTYSRISKSHTCSPVHWQNNARNTVHVTDPQKMKFLLEGQQDAFDQYASNLYNEYKNAIGSIGQRISSPSQQHYRNSYYSENDNRNYNPYITQRSSTPFYDCEDNLDSRYNTPLHSPRSSFQRSPKKRNISISPTLAQGPTVEEDGRVNYYPNCDATIWLRSCKKEVTEPLSGEHIGQVPLWLAGTLIRNGPGRLEVGDQKYNHLFDGSALLHRFHFCKGKVTYQNRFLKSNSYLRDTKAQRIVVNYFGTRAHPDPCRTILQNIASKFDFEEHFTDNAQISLYPYGDGLYALTETPFIFRVDPETLETHEKVNLTKYVAVLTHTAHPHVDKDGTIYNIGQGVGPIGPKYHICKFPKAKSDKKGKTKSPFDQAQIVGSVNARWRFNPCYMHSFSMTENYWIIIEQPLVVSVHKIIRVVLSQDALIDALQWWEKETKIHVIRRDTGETITTQYVTETFFFLHTINAYEEKGHIILDIASYKNAEMLHCMYVEALKNCSYDPTYAQTFRGRPKRWVIPLKPNKDASVGTNLVTLPGTKCQGRWLKKNVVYLTPELLSDIGCEVPRIYYEKYNGRPYQYFYAICSDVDHPNPGTLVKVNVMNKTHVEWSEDNVYPSEPIFVPHPLAKEEDDGVVLSALLRAKGLDNEVCLLILDASTFKERARVEFVAPGPVPKCLHGWFVPEGTLRVHPKGTEEEENS